MGIIQGLSSFPYSPISARSKMTAPNPVKKVMQAIVLDSLGVPGRQNLHEMS